MTSRSFHRESVYVEIEVTVQSGAEVIRVDFGRSGDGEATKKEFPQIRKGHVLVEVRSTAERLSRLKKERLARELREAFERTLVGLAGGKKEILFFPEAPSASDVRGEFIKGGRIILAETWLETWRLFPIIT